MRKAFHFFTRYLPLFIILIFMCAKLTYVIAQSPPLENSIKQLIVRTDSILGSDDELYNGMIYYQTNRGALGTPYYMSDDWVTSTLVINGKAHAKQLVKYNIVSDQLIVILTQKNGETYPIVLNNDFVDEFYLKSHHFINNKHLEILEERKNFLEKVYEGSFSFYTSYNKLFLKEYNSRSPQGRYSDVTIDYYLLDDKGKQKLTSIKSLLQYLESDKKAVKAFMKEHNIKFKKASVNELNILLQYCDDLKKSAQR